MKEIMGTSAKRIAGLYGKMILLLLLVNFCGCEQQQDKLTGKDKSKVPYYNSPEFTPIWTTDKNVIDTLHIISNFNFTDQNRDTISNATFKNKIYITDFFFTRCPSICPKMTATMKAVYENYKNDPRVSFLSHSVTPEIDSVSVLKKYAVSKGVDNNQWHFVTGNKNDIYTIARKSYFVEQQQGLSYDSTQFLHTENLILIDKKGHIRGLYNGTLPAEIPRIIDDIDGLLKE
jgi:protein SCO1